MSAECLSADRDAIRLGKSVHRVDQPPPGQRLPANPHHRPRPTPAGDLSDQRARPASPARAREAHRNPEGDRGPMANLLSFAPATNCKTLPIRDPPAGDGPTSHIASVLISPLTGHSQRFLSATTGSTTSSCSAATKFQPSNIELPTSKPFRFRLRSPTSSPRRNYWHAV
jgi:hypothetical protein